MTEHEYETLVPGALIDIMTPNVDEVYPMVVEAIGPEMVTVSRDGTLHTLARWELIELFTVAGE